MHNINRICLDNVRPLLTLPMLLTLTQNPTRWSGARVRRDPQALHAQHQPHLPRHVRPLLTLPMLLTLTQDPTRWSGARVRRDPQALHAQHQPHLPRQRAPLAHPTDVAHPHPKPHSLERGASSS